MIPQHQSHPQWVDCQGRSSNDIILESHYLGQAGLAADLLIAPVLAVRVAVTDPAERNTGAWKWLSIVMTVTKLRSREPQLIR